MRESPLPLPRSASARAWQRWSFGLASVAATLTAAVLSFALTRAIESSPIRLPALGVLGALWIVNSAAIGILATRAWTTEGESPIRRRARAGISLGLALTVSAGMAPIVAGDLDPAWPVVILGTFTAASASILRGLPGSRLWEDNQPPSGDLERRVRERHLSVLPGRLHLDILKRAFDFALSSWGLLLGFPFAWVTAFALWWQDPGPILFVKHSVGLAGRSFRQWKYRTMIVGAEERTGPVWSARDDPRVVGLGHILRKTALDEFPQLWNILLGEMSFVGPRPQRTVLVGQYLEMLPSYVLRHQVRPGLAGLAQVAGHYYITPRQKLRLDLLYVRHAGLGFDLRLLAAACALVFWLRWRGPATRLPRAWLHPRRRPLRPASSLEPGATHAS